MRKIETVNGFDVYFEAEKEELSKKHHFINECGWTAEEYKGLSKTKWFCAHIQIVKAGFVLSDQYLGCCCYNTVKEFYTTYRNDYYMDMLSEGIREAKAALPALIEKTQTTLEALAA